jgi:hypothetical protein
MDFFMSVVEAHVKYKEVFVEEEIHVFNAGL